MLAYLDALLAAVGARDAEEIERLLAHPLGRILTRAARAEAEAAGACGSRGAPLDLLQLRHQTAQLLGARAAAREEHEARRSVPPTVRRSDRPAPRREETRRPQPAQA
ncbi:MAG TPA: hypothetical protein VJL28_12380 [Gemmatimonadaceae bacterium]|nr:hypothetical protein [Gemmatimonadaceae bacterium]